MARNASLLTKDLLDVICNIASTSGRVYVVMDGLDEFTQSAKLLKYLPQSVAAKAKVVISSRDLPSIATQCPTQSRLTLAQNRTTSSHTRNSDSRATPTSTKSSLPMPSRKMWLSKSLNSAKDREFTPCTTSS